MPADFVQRGQKLCAEAQFQEAVKVCRLGLLAHPTEIDGRLVLGTALMALSRHDEVLAEMRVALELDHDNPRALALKGEALLRKGDALQAHDVLARAVSAAPADPAIRELYGEARRIREGAMPEPSRMPAPVFDAPPLAPPPRAGETRSGAWAAAVTPASNPRLGAARGERTGTIEIDPDIEGVEVESSASRTGTLDLPTDVQEDSDEAIELSTQDLMAPPRESGPAFDSVDGPFAPRSSSAQRAIPPVDAPVDQPPVRRSGNWQAPVAGPADRTRAILDRAPMPSSSTAAPPPLDQMFPDDEEGVSGIEIVGPGGGAPGGGQVWVDPRARTDDMRMIRQGLGLSPEGSSPGRVPPRRDEPGVPQGYPPGPGPQVQYTGGHAPRGVPSPRGRAEPQRRRRRGIPLIVYALLALLVLGGAVLTGIKVRDMRLSGQVETARETADVAAALDTHAGYLHALEAHGRIVRAQDTATHRAARAVVAARMAASLGEGGDAARAMVSELGDSRDLDAVLARGLLAIADGDVETARGASTDLAAAVAGSADALLLRGRASMLEQKMAEAAEALRAAVEAQPRAATLVALAHAEAELGRTAEALAALDRAAQVSPGHAGAVIWRARIQARARQLPALPEPEQALEGIIAEAKVTPAQQKTSVSPGQGGWAALVLAEVKLQRGDTQGAKAAMAQAQAAQAPRDLLFRPAMAAILMSLGEVAAARAQVELALAERPASPATRVLEARVALDAGDTNAALAALAAMGDLSRNAEALALRGRVHLAAGSVDPAGVDLDAALALRPDLRDALIARAEVDLARGDARTALKRLEPVVGDGSAAGPDIVGAAAAAHRMGGDVAAARGLLERFATAQPDKAADPRVLLEKARLERAAGAFEAAAELYGKASAAAPRGMVARLEAATLALDRGDAAGARSQLDALLAESGQSAAVMAEAARLRTITGDHAGALELLDRASAMPAPSPALVRERGRLLLRKRDAERATQELERARSLAPDDRETHVLLMQAYLMRKNAAGAKRELENVTKSFRGSPLVPLTRGLEALVRARARDAAIELGRAYEVAAGAKSSPRDLGHAAFWTGHALYFTGDLPGAGEWLKKAIGHDPSLADAHFLLGQIAFEGGMADKMAQRYEKAVELDASGNPSAWYFLGEHYAQKSKGAEAKKALDTYLARWPDGDFAADAKDLLAKLK